MSVPTWDNGKIYVVSCINVAPSTLASGLISCLKIYIYMLRDDKQMARLKDMQFVYECRFLMRYLCVAL